MLNPFVVSLGCTLLKIVCLLIAIAYFTIAERKMSAAIQRRRGPNVVGVYGLLQPLADGLKLLAKESMIPSHANSRIFVSAPLVVLTLGLSAWSVIPFGCHDHSEYLSKASTAYSVKEFLTPCLFSVHHSRSDKILAFTPPAPTFSVSTFTDFTQLTEMNSSGDVRYGLLFILALSSLTVYGLIISGWASNSKYAFLGALRSAAQSMSYEVSMSLIILPIMLLAGSLNFAEIVHSQQVTVSNSRPLFPISGMYSVSSIAETNRTPFDLPEAEAELVAGYNVDYSSIMFASFFLAEYGNSISSSIQKASIFLGGAGVGLLEAVFNSFVEALLLSTKTLIFCFIFVLVRATFPRYRYDQLSDMGWKTFLPVTTGFFIFVVSTLYSSSSLILVDQMKPSPFVE